MPRNEQLGEWERRQTWRFSTASNSPRDMDDLSSVGPLAFRRSKFPDPVQSLGAKSEFASPGGNTVCQGDPHSDPDEGP